MRLEVGISQIAKGRGAVGTLRDCDEDHASVSSSLQVAMRLLLEASKLAEEVGCTVWDFAVEIRMLQQAGVTNSRLRWLVCKGLAEHGREAATTGRVSRSFQSFGGLTFTDETSFVLTARGVEFARQVLSQLADRPPSMFKGSNNGFGEAPTLIPTWDQSRQELRLGTVVVKQFKVRAANQERILAAFEEEGWPWRIDDPLPPQADQDPKRRLHDTINSLNHSQKQRLVHFVGDGTGQGIRWELVKRTSRHKGRTSKSRRASDDGKGSHRPHRAR